jgi:hypothetical protein
LVTLLKVFFLPFLVVFPSLLLAHQQQASEIFKYKFESRLNIEGQVHRILDRTGRKCMILYIFACKEETKRAGSGSGPDPIVRGRDPRIRVLTKMPTDLETLAVNIRQDN